VIVRLATSNAGKLREFEALGARAGWRFELPPGYIAPPEVGATYAANAAIKARALWSQFREAGRPAAVLGDDSGLEIAALQGRPGIRSARYGGTGAGWPERRRALLEELDRAQTPNRAARFVCALHFVGHDGLETSCEASYGGTIASGERGTFGFSYDAIFVDPETGRTFAELPADEKDAKSHRARAFASLVERIHAG